ncbi:MAG: SBBP repeat-containing protein, partial [Chloroflexota bacterium]|nr:SBBP repeat-containing protein [Chloroflexota bacterium]
VNGDAFVTKLNGSGARVYSMYLGGNGNDRGNGIAVDASGNAYVTGNTDSTDFPVTNGSTLGDGMDNSDVFMTKLDTNGVRVYSTHLGGSGGDLGNGIAVDAGGNAYVTGFTASMDFPVTNGSIRISKINNAFVTKIVVSVPLAIGLATFPDERLEASYSQVAITASGDASSPLPPRQR